MPLDQTAKIYRYKTKTLYPYEHFGLDFYQKVIGNPNIEVFKYSLSNELQHKKSITLIKTTVIKLVKI